jgi:glycosyltransferase involved in cell wall biosynthesis
MRKTRVVFLTSSASAYGGENALFESIKCFSSDIESIVVAPESGDLLKSLERLGVKTIVLPFAVLDRRYFHPLRIVSYKVSAIISTFRLVSLFKRIKPDVVHTNNVLVLPGAVAARMLGIPHVWHVREIIEHHHLPSLLWRIWRWIILTFSSRVICISSAVREQFGEERKAIVIHDGIDTDLFHLPAKRRGQKKITVGIVGRLEHRRKGQDTFIEAARIALEIRKDLRFIIVGHEREEIAEHEQTLHDTVRRYGLTDKIEFQGLVPREKMPELMQELDVLVLCSKQPEGLGIALLEAMACGRVVISFAEGGPLDVVKDHVNGLLVPAQNTRGLAEAIVELAGDAKLRAKLGIEGRKTVVSSFRNEMTARGMGQVYRQIRK